MLPMHEKVAVIFSSCGDCRCLLSSPPSEVLGDRDRKAPARMFPKPSLGSNLYSSHLPTAIRVFLGVLEKLGKSQSKHCQGVFSWEHRTKPKRHHVIALETPTPLASMATVPSQGLHRPAASRTAQCMGWPVNPSGNHFRTVSVAKLAAKSRSFP